jgi:hypothetical protein
MLGGYLKKWPNFRGVSEVIPFFFLISNVNFIKTRKGAQP